MDEQTLTGARRVLTCGKRAGERFVELAQRSSVAFALLVATAFGLATALQEKIGICDGLGDDACQNYGPWVKDFVGRVLRDRVDSYYVQRLLPSGVYYCVMRLLHVPRNNHNIIVAFECGNVVMVLLAAWAWHRIWRYWRLPNETLGLGATLLFGGFAILKWLAFVPALTDAWGFAFGLLALERYLHRSFLGLAVLTTAASFAWPSAALVGGPLLFFLKDDGESPGSQDPAAGNYLFGAVAAGAAVAWVVHAIRIAGTYTPPWNGEVVWTETFRLNALIAGCFVLLVVKNLLSIQMLKPAVRNPLAWYRMGALLLLIGLQYAVHRLAAPNLSAPVTLRMAFDRAVYTSVIKPAGFVVAHVAFFGPAFLLAMFLWTPVSRSMRRSGPGVAFALLSGTPLVLNSESRQLFPQFALAAPFVIKAVSELNWSRRTLIALCAVTIGSSRIWLTLHPTSKNATTIDGIMGTVGPWMSTQTYVAYGVCVAALAVWLGWLCRRSFVSPSGPDEQHTR
jgi:hypothetical protein